MLEINTGQCFESIARFHLGFFFNLVCQKWLDFGGCVWSDNKCLTRPDRSAEYQRYSGRYRHENEHFSGTQVLLLNYMYLWTHQYLNVFRWKRRKTFCILKKSVILWNEMLLVRTTSVFQYWGRFFAAWTWVNHFCSYIKTHGLSWPSLLFFLGMTVFFSCYSWMSQKSWRSLNFAYACIPIFFKLKLWVGQL